MANPISGEYKNNNIPSAIPQIRSEEGRMCIDLTPTFAG